MEVRLVPGERLGGIVDLLDHPVDGLILGGSAIGRTYACKLIRVQLKRIERARQHLGL